ncbi:MAG: hypothetical protein C4318_08050 [Acidimicrobiia bacterium]
MRVTVIYWPECHSYKEAIERVQKVLAEDAIQADIEVLEVNTEEEARRTGFAGSPTILVDGQDIDPASRDESGRLSCRTYTKSDGSLGPLPDTTKIREAIRARIGAEE